jgi:hypothetical protein
MSAPSTPLLSPAWLNQLAPDALMISSVLDRTVVGRDAIVKVIQAAGGLYDSHSIVFSAKFGDRELFEYDAVAFSDVALHGVVTLTRSSTGEIVAVGVHHGPLSAVDKLSSALKELLGTELGAEFFLP